MALLTKAQQRAVAKAWARNIKRREVAAREREARTLVTATGVSADPGGTETKPEQNLHEKGSEG